MIVCARRRRHEAVEDPLHVGRAEHHVRGQVVDQRAGAHRAARHHHLAHRRAARERALGFHERADLREDLVLLAVLDREFLVALRVHRDELILRRREDLDGRVAGVHHVRRRELERVRGAAHVHRLGEHEAAELAWVARDAHDDARRVRFAVRGARREVFLRCVAEVLEVEALRLRRCGVEHRRRARDLGRQRRQLHGRRRRRQILVRRLARTRPARPECGLRRCVGRHGRRDGDRGQNGERYGGYERGDARRAGDEQCIEVPLAVARGENSTRAGADHPSREASVRCGGASRATSRGASIGAERRNE